MILIPHRNKVWKVATVVEDPTTKRAFFDANKNGVLDETDSLVSRKDDSNEWSPLSFKELKEAMDGEKSTFADSGVEWSSARSEGTAPWIRMEHIEWGSKPLGDFSTLSFYRKNTFKKAVIETTESENQLTVTEYYSDWTGLKAGPPR